MQRIAATVLVSCLAGAQAPREDASLVKFTSSTQLVVEAVTVTDTSGKPMVDLKAEDFVVTEDGVPQIIKLFEYQKLDDVPLALPTSTPVPPAAPPPAARAQITPAAPGELRFSSRRLLVLYFDRSAMGPAEQFRALAAARKFLNIQMTAADTVAIMEFSEGSIKVRQDFTADRDRLHAVISQIEALVAGVEEESLSAVGSSFGQDDSEFNLFNTDRQLAALQTTFGMLRRLNEKKCLVYFASGLRLNGVDNQAQLRATLNSAIRANVVLYTVDARGLVADAPLGNATQASPGGVGMYSGGTALTLAGNFQRSQDAFYALAADTGGKALFDNNDLSLGIVKAQKATPSYYLIGYYTTNSALDGKWRKVAINLKGFPSAKLDYRHGYFAGKEFRRFKAADKERQLEDALMLEDPVTDLTIAMEVNYFQLNRAEYYVPVVMKIPGSELVLARKGGAERTDVDFIGEIKDEYNVTVRNIRDKVHIELSGSTAAELATRHIQYDSGYTLLPGSYSIKVLARENETGRIGTYLAKFTIPNLNKETRRIPISSVVLSSQRMNLKDALYTAGKDKEQISNPLVQDGQKLIPSVTRVFRRSRDMYVYLQAYEPGAETVQPLVAFVTFYRGGAKAFETQPLVVNEALNNRLKTVPLKFSIATEKLTPGKYTCQVTVADAKAHKLAFWQASVLVVP